MHEIKDDTFYDFVKQYDSDTEYHFVGEVDYHLLSDNKPYEGLQSHREALSVVFDRLVENSIENQKRARERYGDELADRLSPLVYDINKAHATPLTPNGTDALDIYEWTTDWSDLFDDGHQEIT